MGLPALNSDAKLGPESTMRERCMDGGNSSSITWVISLAECSSMPLVVHTNGRGSEKQGAN